ncbi:MAG: tryptophan-rich sensory protein [Anaerolineales bacterium]|nr:tryptophan-rich sensory protein [Anaerolineales bacterium]
MKKISTNQIITILITLLTITVNVLANALPLNGQETGEISDRFAIYFVPAGYVFAIWGLIYLGLIGYTVYQALPAQRQNALLNKIAPAYWIGNLANTVWIFLWHYNIFPVTLIAMLILLASLLYIYVQIMQAGVLNRTQKWLVRLPFSLYLGWISVATIANFSQVLYYLNWNGFGVSGPAWAAIMTAVAAVIGLIMAWCNLDVAYVLVLVWAFVGIANQHTDTALVANSALAAAGVLAVALIAAPILKPRIVKDR